MVECQFNLFRNQQKPISQGPPCIHGTFGGLMKPSYWLVKKKSPVNSKIASLFQNESQTSKTYDFINITLPYVNKTYQNVSLLTYDSSI